MPVVSPHPDALILVTGASGFLGSYIVEDLLNAGYRVRITARSDAKAEHVRSHFPEHKDRIEYQIVEDMVVPGAFDLAVRGVDGIVHTASPVTMIHSGHPDDLIKPAVGGVKNILGSVERENPRLKRFVQLSSVAAIGSFGWGGKSATAEVLTEENWNHAAIEDVSANGINAKGNSKYAASKMQAEEAFWEQIAGKPYDGIVINPSVVLGPQREYIAEGARSASSPSLILRFLTRHRPTAELDRPYFNIVDVRDVAAAITRSLAVPHAAGNRFILSSHPISGNDVVLAAEDHPQLTGYSPGNRDPAHRSAIAAVAPRYDGSKVERTLGFTYRDKDDTLSFTIGGWVPMLTQSRSKL